ncbi:unnamed protein product [Protopolystoma xenopodis]|uniref:Uncharacterized protein n=1 Tax=Protopolystoma xenopodis TaxID=117903 RepID=A0A448WBK0_9PLAT|nr:unnamed protein product [Protopolystoma xenopodis]
MGLGLNDVQEAVRVCKLHSRRELSLLDDWPPKMNKFMTREEISCDKSVQAASEEKISSQHRLRFERRECK